MAEAATLVIAPRWVGDMVMAQCLFMALKRADPDRPIDVMAPAWAAPLVARMPEVRARIDAPFGRGSLEIPARWRAGRALAGRYDRAYVLQGSWKSALVPFFAGVKRRTGYLREQRWGLLNDIRPLPQERKRKTAWTFQALADPGDVVPPRLAVDAANQASQLARFGLERGGFVALVPGAEYGPAKRWPPEHYANLANRLKERGLAAAMFGSGNDRATAAAVRRLAPQVVDCTGETRLEDAVDLIAAARFAVTNDSGLMHVAAAVGTPVVAVYGSTSPDNTPPLGDRSKVVWLGLSCSPCHQKTCPLGHLNCLVMLDTERVLAAAGDLGVLPSDAPP